MTVWICIYGHFTHLYPHPQKTIHGRPNQSSFLSLPCHKYTHGASQSLLPNGIKHMRIEKNPTTTITTTFNSPIIKIHSIFHINQPFFAAHPIPIRIHFRLNVEVRPSSVVAASTVVIGTVVHHMVQRTRTYLLPRHRRRRRC